MKKINIQGDLDSREAIAASQRAVKTEKPYAESTEILQSEDYQSACTAEKPKKGRRKAEGDVKEIQVRADTVGIHAQI